MDIEKSNSEEISYKELQEQGKKLVEQGNKNHENKKIDKNKNISGKEIIIKIYN